MIIQTSSSHAYIPISEPAAAGAIDLAVRNGGDRVRHVHQSFGAKRTGRTPDNGARPAAATNQAPTYLRDIQPIFMGNCSRCHNQQSRFVYDWLDYKTAYADRWEIRRRIWDSWKGTYYKEAMPVANSPESLALTDEERLTIRNWVDDGGLRGVPPPPGAAKSKAERIRTGQAAVHFHLRGVPPAHGHGTPQYVSTFGGIGLFECRQEPGHTNCPLWPAGRSGGEWA